MSELEFGLIIAWHAFARWMMRCATAAGVKDMTPIDVLVLHHVAHRDTDKRLADECPDRRTGPTAAYAVRALRPGRTRSLDLIAVNEGTHP